MNCREKENDCVFVKIVFMHVYLYKLYGKKFKRLVDSSRKE